MGLAGSLHHVPGLSRCRAARSRARPRPLSPRPGGGDCARPRPAEGAGCDFSELRPWPSAQGRRASLPPQPSPDAAASVRLTSLFNQTTLIFERQGSPREERCGSRIDHRAHTLHAPGPRPGAWLDPPPRHSRTALNSTWEPAAEGKRVGPSPLCTATTSPTSGGRRLSFLSKEQGGRMSFSGPGGRSQLGSGSHVLAPPTRA